MSIKLNEIWTAFEAAETTPALYIKTEFNKLTPLGVEEMTETEASALTFVIENRLTYLMNCKTIFSDTESGITNIKNILKFNLYAMVAEIRNIAKALSSDIATQHVRNLFNPVDNDNIDNAPTRTDDTSFTYVANMISQVEYLKDNSRTLNDLYNDFTQICYILGE